MGKNPQSFADRVELGDQARISGDFIGALVEYSEALKINEDPKIHVKLGDIYFVRGDYGMAIADYQAATKLADSADVELKLGQAYQANKNVSNALVCYEKAISFRRDDPNVQEALVAGWNEALKENPLAPENHIGLGRAFQHKGDFSQAQAEFKQAILFSPGHANATAQGLLEALPAAKAQADKMKLNNIADLQGGKQSATNVSTSSPTPTATAATFPNQTHSNADGSDKCIADAMTRVQSHLPGYRIQRPQANANQIQFDTIRIDNNSPREPITRCVHLQQFGHTGI